jgi:hypothetical protein
MEGWSAEDLELSHEHARNPCGLYVVIQGHFGASAGMGVS